MHLVGGPLGLDPAGGLFVDEGYLPLAAAPDPLRALPVVGYREACEERCVESLRVRRLTPTQRAWPYTRAQWADLRALGCYLEQDLAKRGLRPALGTTLSLVSTYEAEAPEWNTAALGLSKRQAADELLQRLWLRLAPGGAPQLGQGEWYAGDALPRWRLGCFFRADGRPLWRNPERLGWRRAGDEIGLNDARDFAQALAGALGHAGLVDPAVPGLAQRLFEVESGATAVLAFIDLLVNLAERGLDVRGRGAEERPPVPAADPGIGGRGGRGLGRLPRARHDRRPDQRPRHRRR